MTLYGALYAFTYLFTDLLFAVPCWICWLFLALTDYNKIAAAILYPVAADSQTGSASPYTKLPIDTLNTQPVVDYTCGAVL